MFPIRRRDRLLRLMCSVGLAAAGAFLALLLMASQESSQCVRYVEEHDLLASCVGPPDEWAYLVAGAAFIASFFAGSAVARRPQSP